jgi:DNA polymerase III subunit gamma/tau
MPALSGGSARPRPNRCYDKPAPPSEMPACTQVAEKTAEPVQDGSTTGVERDTFISAADVRSIINSASFLVQEYGVYFNVSLEVKAALFGRSEQAPSIQLIKQFERELEEQAAHWSPQTAFARLTLYELCDGEYRGLIVARLPRPTEEDYGFGCLEEFDDWCRQWKADERVHPASEAIRIKLARQGSAERSFHWRETLHLCAGLSEGEVDFDTTGEEQPLLQLLRINRPRWHRVRSLLLPAGQRPFTASTVLQPEAIEHASRYGMRPLSAYDDKAWDQLQRGWELDEYKDRHEIREERRRESEKQSRMHGKEQHRLSDDPHDRPRSWRVWW